MLQLFPHPLAKAAGWGIEKAGIYGTPAIFGLSQAQQTRETAQERGVEEGLAPYATGGIDWVGETAANVALEGLLGRYAPVGKAAVSTARSIFKPTLINYLTAVQITPNRRNYP